MSTVKIFVNDLPFIQTRHVFQYQTKGEWKGNQDVMKHQKFIKYNKDPIVEYCWISNAMKIQ